MNAPRVVPRQYVTAFILVTSLFFMWAIAHNLNDILIRQFQKALDLSRGQASFVQVSFYLAYAFAAIPAGYAMKRLGFKRAILTGLLLYALGAAMFYPAAEVGNYSFFLVALFIIAIGIVFLETSGSGYITLVGDPSTAARRINFAQSFNGLGGFIAPLIGGVFIFSGIEHTPEAIAALSPQALQEYRVLEARQVQVPYLSLAGILVLVALLVAVTRFPAPRARASATGKATLAGVFAYRSFVWAIVAQFFYVGAQIGVWSYFIDFTKEVTPLTPEKTAAFYLSASLLSFMVGRFIGTYLMKFVAPRTLLGIYALINIGLVTIALGTSGMTAVFAVGATSFFMSIMFPTIYALGLEHLGDQAEMGSSLIIMTIISGAIIPPTMGYLSDVQSVQWAYAVPLVCYGMVWISTRLGGRESRAGRAVEQPA
ncbi:MAG: L-fucose:H+ symporter permease [Halioglobus sp.]|nr:L-fucose:H+ symporter permease [Halioglobus sp.]